MITLIHSEALEALRTLPDNSVHCLVTSPPYYGVRDYGTGKWIGGSATCDHKRKNVRPDHSGRTLQGRGQQGSATSSATPFKDVCRICGATRVDQQLGLECTIEEYIARLVTIFREARRVLHPTGTLWMNMGDSYVSGGTETNRGANRPSHNGHGLQQMESEASHPPRVRRGKDCDPKRGSSAVGQPFKLGAPGLKNKDLIGMPWRLALALQSDGWWLRSDIIWNKTNPMPGSQKDRPTTCHEYIFLLTKRARYFCDMHRIEEPVTGNAHARGNGTNPKANMPTGWAQNGTHKELGGRYRPPGPNSRMAKDRDPAHQSQGRIRSKQNRSFSAAVLGLVSKRNKRSVWTVPTAPYKGAHFATFPKKLIIPCIRAGTSEVGCCPTCLTPWERILEKGEPDREWQQASGGDANGQYRGQATKDFAGAKAQNASDVKRRILEGMCEKITVGWRKRCRCPYATPIPCTVADMFAGSGTTGEVAMEHGCHAILVELAAHYLPLIHERCNLLI